MTIAIIGAGGFLGRNLINYLLEHTSHLVIAISHHAPPLPDNTAPKYAGRVSFVQGDIFDEDQLTNDLANVDVAFYFVHMMGQKNVDFYSQEAIAAHRFSAAVITAGVKRVVYMGGLGNDHEQLSAHLASRHNTGTILRENCPLVIEFRASMIVGTGSVAFDIIDNLVRKLPVMALPPWSNTLTQPISLVDALEYLTQSISVPLTHHQIIEIGGSTIISYKALYRHYAQWLNKKPLIITLPFIPVWLASHWLNIFTPKVHARIGRIMVDSMSNTMVVTHDQAQRVFPDIHPRSLQTAFDDVKAAAQYDKIAQ